MSDAVVISYRQRCQNNIMVLYKPFCNLVEPVYNLVEPVYNLVDTTVSYLLCREAARNFAVFTVN